VLYASLETLDMCSGTIKDEQHIEGVPSASQV